MKWLPLSVLIFAMTVQAQEPAPAPNHPRPALTSDQKAQLGQQADEAWGKLPPEAKAQLMQLHKALTQMPPAERKFIRDRVTRFLQMTPAERDQLRKNAELWKKMTPEQRDQARQEFRQRRADFEKQWQQDHPGEELPFPPRAERPPPPPDNVDAQTQTPPKENP